MKKLFLIMFLTTATSLIACSQTSRPKTVGSTNSNKKNVYKSALAIRKAVYGSLPDGTAMDVTDKVRAMVKNGRLSVLVSDENLGDPYKGTMNLTIIRATIKAPNLNFGGEDGAGDFTDQIKQFQEGNSLTAKMSGDMKVTVYYKYGEGETLSKEEGEDGSIIILPPTKLHVDYNINGMDLRVNNQEVKCYRDRSNSHI